MFELQLVYVYIPILDGQIHKMPFNTGSTITLVS